MNKYISKYIAKKYQNAINDFYKDSEGWWITLKSESGFRFEGYYSDYTIHEDTLNEALKSFRESIKGK